MPRIKVRFNLGRGKNYMKWKVTYSDGNIEYLDPNLIQLILKNSELKNQKKTAEKITQGGNKRVCAWVLCDEIEIVPKGFNELYQEEQHIRFNPRVKPYWFLDGTDINMDSMKFSRIESFDSSLYIIN